MHREPHLAIEPEAIGLERGAGGDGGGGGQVLRVQRDADAGIDGQDELLVALAPVLDDGDVAGRAGRLHHHPWLPLFPHRQSTEVLDNSQSRDGDETAIE